VGLVLTNTLTGRKEPVTPRRAGHVGIYWCGVTVYSRSHIGHARALITADVLCRYLRTRGTRVTFVRNFTDIEDKIIKRAREEGITTEVLTEREVNRFNEDVAWLRCLRPTHEPRATAHVAEMLAMIEQLVASGHAYPTPDGSVYFRVRRFADYGKLSHQLLDNMATDDDADSAKEDPHDFALWKGAKPGEPAWETPYGPGRPGWHIECSAMASQYLGNTLDIHGGGQDLIFPHHENEIAQSEAANGVTFARFWCHNGMVNLQGEKMSKSTKLYFLIEDIAKDFEPELVRFYLSSTHYRSPIEFGVDRLSEARTAWQRIRQPMERFGGFDETPAEAPSAAMQSAIAEAETRFTEAMNDDANTARAIGYLFDLAREVNKAGESGDAAQAKAGAQALRKLGSWIGLFWTQSAEGEAEWPAEVLDLVARREAARKSRNFKEADELRDKLKALGVVVEDGAQGPRIKAGV
jgi:cysteinyl-tRNA synthetase